MSGKCKHVYLNPYGILLLLLKLKGVYVNILSHIPVSYADAYTEESFQNIVLLV